MLLMNQRQTIHEWVYTHASILPSPAKISCFPDLKTTIFMFKCVYCTHVGKVQFFPKGQKVEHYY